MRLKVLLPTEVLVDEEVTKVIAEAQNGSFCLLPRHIDFVAALTPGIVSYETVEGEEVFLAVDEGILVKIAQEILVSTRNAMRGPELGQLKNSVKEQFKMLDEREKMTRSALAKIEASFVRRFLEFREHA